MVIVGMIALRPPMAPTGGLLTPPYFGTGDWDVNALGGTCTNEVLVVNGNVMVEQDSELDLVNCTLYINGTIAGQYEFNSSVDPDGGGPLLGGIVRIVNSTISPGPYNTSANFRFKMLGDTFHLNGSTVIGAGIASTKLFDTGVYVNTTTRPLIFNSFITDGYNGLVLDQLPTAVGATVKGLTSARNIRFGILATQSHNVSILDSNVSYSIVAAGINISQGGNVTINNTFVWKNGGRGISHEPGISFALTQPYITNNDIRNNTGLAIFHTSTLSPNPTIQGNTMCWNGGSVVFNTGLIAPQFNFFCVNITSPRDNAFVRNGTMFNYTVSNNPTGQMVLPGGGNTSCVVNFNATNQSYAFQKLNASAPETRSFTNNTLDDGTYVIEVFCDPYLNLAQSEKIIFIRDAHAPTFSGRSVGGTCENMVLAVQWGDATTNVSHVILATNETGVLKNYTGGTYGSPMAVLNQTAWTNFSWWNSTVKTQTVSWQVWANDSAGNENITDIVIFNATPCAVSQVVAPTLPPSGGEQAVQTCAVGDLPEGGSMFVFQPVAPNGVATCSAKGVINYLRINFAGVTNLPTTLSVAKVTAPSDIPPPSLATYAWLNVTKTLPDAAIGKATVRFAVPTDWLTENAVDPAGVLLYRWISSPAPGKWEPIAAKMVSSDNVTVYESVLPGFSVFAIGGPQSCPQCPEPSDYSECIDGRHGRTEYMCSEETGFACRNTTLTRDCVCPDCPQPSFTECVGRKHTRTTYTCSADTNFDCLASESVESCGLPRLLPFLNLEQFPEEQRTLVDMAIIGGAIAGVAVVWYFLMRPHGHRAPLRR